LPPCRSLTLLINDLRMRRADDQEQVVLVLDDYRVITTESIHHVLSLRSLLGCDDVANFITAFSGCHYYVMDYLLDEVLSRQSKAVQDFLVQISLLEHSMDLVKGTRLVDKKSPRNYSFWVLACLFVVSYASQRYYLDTPFSGTLPEVLDVRARLYVDAHLVQCYCRDFIYEGFKASVAALIETARKEIQA